MPDGAVLTAIRLDEPVDIWVAAGFAATGGRIRLGGATLEFDAGDPASLGFDRDVGGSFDGIGTHVAPTPDGPAVRHPNGVDGLDHLVVMSGDLDRTLAALDSRHFELRRVRDTVVGGREVSQAFVVAGSAVIEIVGPRLPDAAAGTHAGPTATTVWGIAATATRLDDCVEFWGDGCSPPRPAVQPGRGIISVRPAALTSRYQLAVMSPR